MKIKLKTELKNFNAAYLYVLEEIKLVEKGKSYDINKN